MAIPDTKAGYLAWVKTKLSWKPSSLKSNSFVLDLFLYNYFVIKDLCINKVKSQNLKVGLGGICIFRCPVPWGLVGVPSIISPKRFIS